MSTVIETIERAQLRRVPNFAPGDRVKVHFQVIEGTRKRVQVFEGVVIKRQGHGVRETFTVRKQSFGVGVERMFPVHSPKIERIELAARGDVRRAKLYYLRDRVGKRARVRERRWSAGDFEVDDRFGPEDAAEPGSPDNLQPAEPAVATGHEAAATGEALAEEALDGGVSAGDEISGEEALGGGASAEEASAGEASAEDEVAVASGGTEASVDEASTETKSDTSGGDQSPSDAGDSREGDDAGATPA